MDWWGPLINAGIQAGGAYLQYQDKKDREQDLNRQYQAYLNARELQAKGQQSSGRSGGGGGGNKTAAAKMMEEYLRKAQARYEPFYKAAADILPKQTALYANALPGAEKFVSSALSPEVIADIFRYDRPVQAELPSYLMGGKK